MDIDFLKQQSKSKSRPAKKSDSDFSNVEFSDPNGKKTTPPTPKKAPVKKKPKKPKTSFWQRFKKNPKQKTVLKQESYPPTYRPAPAPTETVSSLPIPPKVKKPKPAKAKPKKVTPPPPPAPAPAPAPAPPPPPAPKPEKKGEIITPPKVTPEAKINDLREKDINKIKNGEISSHFLDVNLIPDKLLAELKPGTKIRSLIIIAIIALAFVLLVYAGMLWYQFHLVNKALATQEEIKKIEQEINSYKPWQEQALAFNQKVEDITKVLDKHIYWTNFFSLLEQNTLPDVYYQNLSGDISGTFTLSAVAPSYEHVSQQIAVFNQADFVSQVSATTASASQNTDEQSQGNAEIKFNITITVEPEVFYYSDQL